MDLNKFLLCELCREFASQIRENVYLILEIIDIQEYICETNQLLRQKYDLINNYICSENSYIYNSEYKSEYKFYQSIKMNKIVIESFSNYKFKCEHIGCNYETNTKSSF